MKLAIIIPAFNEENTIKKVVQTLPKTFPKVTRKEIIVINDGSSDETAKIAKKLPVTLISHHLNRGLGAALGTGFEYAKKNNFDCLVTFDADGQHDPGDIYPVIKPVINKKTEIAIGSRLKSVKTRRGMPWYRIIGIWGLNMFTLFFYWTWTTDSQSGLRAFSKNAIGKIQLKSAKMEVSSEFFNEAQRNNLKITEVPIRSIYTKYSLAKGQKNSNAFKIIWRMVYRRFFGK